MSKKEPQRYTFKEIISPVIKTVKGFFSMLFKFVRRELGFWYCGYCGKYHDPLVIRYDVAPETDDVCSLAIDYAVENYEKSMQEGDTNET